MSKLTISPKPPPPPCRLLTGLTWYSESVIILECEEKRSTYHDSLTPRLVEYLNCLWPTYPHPFATVCRDRAVAISCGHANDRGRRYYSKGHSHAVKKCAVSLHVVQIQKVNSHGSNIPSQTMCSMITIFFGGRTAVESIGERFKPRGSQRESREERGRAGAGDNTRGNRMGELTRPEWLCRSMCRRIPRRIPIFNAWRLQRIVVLRQCFEGSMREREPWLHERVVQTRQMNHHLQEKPLPRRRLYHLQQHQSTIPHPQPLASKTFGRIVWPRHKSPSLGRESGRQKRKIGASSWYLSDELEVHALQLRVSPGFLPVDDGSSHAHC
jgi:hypothetical protein